MEFSYRDDQSKFVYKGIELDIDLLKPTMVQKEGKIFIEINFSKFKTSGITENQLKKIKSLARGLAALSKSYKLRKSQDSIKPACDWQNMR